MHTNEQKGVGRAGRLAMLAFVGFVMAAQVTGLGPLAALGQHLSDPISAPCIFIRRPSPT